VLRRRSIPSPNLQHILSSYIPVLYARVRPGAQELFRRGKKNIAVIPIEIRPPRIPLRVEMFRIYGQHSHPLPFLAVAYVGV
jgi:hypothetical protein